MSFILDALKKSEQERARQQAPTTLELPRGTQRRVVPIWMIGVVLLLLVNCVLLLLMWLKRDEPAQPAATTIAAQPAVAQTDTRPATASGARPGNVIRSLEEEATVEPAAGAEADEADTGLPRSGSNDVRAREEQPLVRTVSGAVQSSVSAAPVRPETPSSRVTSGMPTLESLGGHTALNLPELRLDLHVYAGNAKDRFVFINGKRYHEGELTAEGVNVEAITDDGVVLSSRGRRFLLPR